MGINDEYKKEILKKEIDLIDNAIGRIDEIRLRKKNYTLLIWGGSLFLIVEVLGGQPNRINEKVLIFFTTLIPFLFGALDVIWKQALMYCSLRQEKISDFLNGTGDAPDFKILDPIGKQYLRNRAISKWQAFRHKDATLFYIILMIISIVFGLMYKT